MKAGQLLRDGDRFRRRRGLAGAGKAIAERHAIVVRAQDDFDAGVFDVLEHDRALAAAHEMLAALAVRRRVALVDLGDVLCAEKGQAVDEFVIVASDAER